MSLEAREMLRLMKRAAVEAVRAEGPAAVCLGRVDSVDPLQITVDQKLHLTGAQLYPTRTLHGLEEGERAVLLRCDGGQSYVVLDRWEEM